VRVYCVFKPLWFYREVGNHKAGADRDTEANTFPMQKLYYLR
jgi:hypothetical protein